LHKGPAAPRRESRTKKTKEGEKTKRKKKEKTKLKQKPPDFTTKNSKQHSLRCFPDEEKKRKTHHLVIKIEKKKCAAKKLTAPNRFGSGGGSAGS
jgi:hypothetical protein